MPARQRPPPPLLALPAPPPAPPAPLAPPWKTLAQSTFNDTTVVADCTVRRLTPSQIDERRHPGLYFNCDERYVRDHNRSCMKLFFLDVEDDDAEDTEEAGDLRVSLLAATNGGYDARAAGGFAADGPRRAGPPP